MRLGDGAAKSTRGEARDKLVEIFGFQSLQAIAPEQLFPHTDVIRNGIDALDVDAAMRDAGVSLFGEIATCKAHIATFGPGGWTLERAVVGPQFQTMTVFNPGLERHVTGSRRGLDKADHVEQRSVRFAGTGAQRAPHRTIWSGIDTAHSTQLDAIPAAGGCPRRGAAKELKPDGPGDALAVAQIRSTIVATAIFEEHLWCVMLRVLCVALRRAIKGIAQCEICHVEVSCELMMRELLAIRDGFKSVRSAILGQQCLERNVDAKQIVHRMLILDPREPAAAHATIRSDVGPVRFDQRFIQGGEEDVFVGLLRLRLFLWRHLAIAHALENALQGFE